MPRIHRFGRNRMSQQAKTQTRTRVRRSSSGGSRRDTTRPRASRSRNYNHRKQIHRNHWRIQYPLRTITYPVHQEGDRCLQSADLILRPVTIQDHQNLAHIQTESAGALSLSPTPNTHRPTTTYLPGFVEERDCLGTRRMRASRAAELKTEQPHHLRHRAASGQLLPLKK